MNANDSNDFLPPSAEEEINEPKKIADELLAVAQSKYEDISKLVTGLAAGALVLSVSLLGNLVKGGISCWSKSILLFSWIAFVVSISFGLYLLYGIYRFYREVGFKNREITEEAEGKVEKIQPIGRLTFEGRLIAKARAEKQKGTSVRPLFVQIVLFGIGSVLLLITGFLIITQ